MTSSTLLFLLTITCLTTLSAQTLVDFEDFDLGPDTFRNGANLDGGAFDAGGVLLPNEYTSTPEFDFWSGWAISTERDTSTPGFMNQYSAFPGSGAEASETFAVGFGSGTAIRLAEPGQIVREMYVANTTYSALAIRDGSAPPAKRFGGAGGDDPDFFSVSFRGWRDGVRSADSVTVFLADYRPEDNALDSILTDWRRVDLSSLGAVDSVTLSFASSDVGEFGINTPTYVAIDNIAIGTASRTTITFREPAPAVSPNPATTWLDVAVDDQLDYAIHDAGGRRVATGSTAGRIDLADLPLGVYALRLRGPAGWTAAARFVRAD